MFPNLFCIIIVERRCTPCCQFLKCHFLGDVDRTGVRTCSCPSSSVPVSVLSRPQCHTHTHTHTHTGSHSLTASCPPIVAIIGDVSGCTWISCLPIINYQLKLGDCKLARQISIYISLYISLFHTHTHTLSSYTPDLFGRD